MDNTIWSLVPPILAIVMVLLTRRVLLSLGVGIVAAIVGVGYLVLGLTGSVWVGLITVVVALVVLFYVLKKPTDTLMVEEESIAK